jgi:hypothetical protein
MLRIICALRSYYTRNRRSNAAAAAIINAVNPALPFCPYPAVHHSLAILILGSALTNQKGYFSL